MPPELQRKRLKDHFYDLSKVMRSEVLQIITEAFDPENVSDDLLAEDLADILEE